MKIRTLYLAAIFSLAFVPVANAVPIINNFNFVPTGTLTANTGNVSTATTITSGAPDLATVVISTNINLLAGTAITLTSPTPVTLGATFQKSFTTSAGSFLENLTVTLVSAGATSLGITATGTITGGGFDPTPVFYSAAYTQNAQGQINASFNNSTTPPTQVPEPISLAIFGTGLAVFAAMRRKAQRS